MALEVLVVDDEADIRELVSGVLEDEGYAVRTAADSSQTLDAVEERRPSMVLLDVWLQGSRLKWTRRIVQGYIQLFRNTPPLVQMFFFYFGLSSLLPTMKNSFGMQEPLISGFAVVAREV